MFLLLSLSCATAVAASAPEPDWQTTLEEVVPGIVAINIVQTRAFDTENAKTSQATGFVVDAERGILLTNRHVVGNGPILAEAVLLNNEEIPLKPIYRDPVHDFGFFQFDPEAVKHMDLVELELAPERLEIGMEIRVIGNDASEKISILDGTIARLDRDAPDYSGYRDWNTFYVQAASGTSGGSSGSPVIDVYGQVVALNAGSNRRSAASFYLPLDRVVRALELVQQGQEVPRGTVQAIFKKKAYDELTRLGLGPEEQAAARARFPESTGLLVVDRVFPQGPSDGKLRPGDIILTVNGVHLDSFKPWEEAVDDSVGETVELGIQRGGADMSVTLDVGDLHALSPSEFLEFGGGVMHPMSVHKAFAGSVPVGGVIVAAPGYALKRAGVPPDAVLDSVDGLAVESLDQLEAQLAAKPHGAQVRVVWHSLHDPRAQHVSVVTVDRLWWPMQRCARDAMGSWPCAPSPEPTEVLKVQTASASLDAEGPRAVRVLAPSMVLVDFDVAFPVEGTTGTSFQGHGLVVDTERGLVLCDRDTVPHLAGDVQLTVAGSVRIPARVVAVHPVHNLAIVQYDPARLGDTPIRAASLVPGAEAGDHLWQVGLSSGGEPVYQEVVVTRVDPPNLSYPSVPRLRETNVSLLQVDDYVSSVGGVLCDRRGRVSALWASFPYSSGRDTKRKWRGLPIEVAVEMLDALRTDTALRDVGAEMDRIPLADARDRGLSPERATALEAHDSTKHVLVVRRLAAGTPAHAVLAGGDIVLEVNGEPATRFRELEVAAQAPSVSLLVLRDGTEQTFEVSTISLDGLAVERFAVWAGVVLHDPHYEIAYQRGLEPQGVYLSYSFPGTPNRKYQVFAATRVVAVNGDPVADLDAFLAAVSELEDGAVVRLTMRDLDDKEYVRTLELDLAFWPTRVFSLSDEGWVAE